MMCVFTDQVLSIKFESSNTRASSILSGVRTLVPEVGLFIDGYADLHIFGNDL